MNKLFLFKRLAVVLLLPVCCPVVLNAQGFGLMPTFGIMPHMQRFEIGFSYAMPFASYKQTFILNDNRDTTIKTNNIRPMLAPGVAMGLSFPLSKMNDKCMLALGMAFQGNLMVWEFDAPAYGGTYIDDEGHTSYTFHPDSKLGGTMQLALPLSADFKFGNEAFLAKNMRWGSTFGAGAYTSMALTAFEEGKMTWGVTPFVKADFNVFLGICFKIRALYAFGKIPFYTGDETLANYNNMQVKTSMNAGQQLTVSFLFMPVSWAWGTKGWWNSY